MPIFEYKCQNPGCGEQFQQLILGRKYIDPVCPTCRCEVKKLVSEFSTPRGYPAFGSPSGTDEIEFEHLGSVKCPCGGSDEIFSLVQKKRK